MSRQIRHIGRTNQQTNIGAGPRHRYLRPTMQQAMNWYFEKQGVSQGPLSEDAMIDLLQRQQMAAETRVWHPGLEEWSILGQLKPEWLKAVAAPAAQPALKRMQTSLPVDSTPPTPLPKPKAGIEAGAAEPPTKEKRGFLQRLFGRGKGK
jgi:hypothetical protein